MKKLVLFFYFLSFSILGFSQNKMKLPNGITIIEVINQSGTTSYSATNSTGQSVPVKVVNAKKANKDNMDKSLCGKKCSFICYECGTSSSRELCCGCLCGINAGKEVLLEKVKGIDKVHSENGLTIYRRSEGKKTSYIGLDKDNKVIALKVKSPKKNPKGPIVNPGDSCWSCTKKGKTTECTFFPCPTK